MRRLALSALTMLGACNEVIVGGGNQHHPDTDVDDGPPDPADDTEVPVAVCHAEPNPATPGAAVKFVGDASRDPDGSELINYRWSLAKKPTGSKAALPTGGENVDGFRPDLAGEYVATLVVTDAWGKPSNTCAATLDVAPAERLYVEVVSSVDDRIRPVLTRGDDRCKPSDCDVDWGGAGADPTTSEVAGKPTILAVDEPADGEYRLSVLDEASLDGWISKTTVDVAVWIDGEEAWSTTVSLELEGKEQELATILWPAKKITPAP
jgi:hypothetical protein